MLGFSSHPRTIAKVNATGAPSGVGLPPELIYEVLSRLPAKSIGRFRCACKQWQNLLYDRQFLKLQFSRNKFHNKLICTTRTVSCPDSYFLTSIDFRYDCYSNSDKVVAIRKRLNFEHSGQIDSILGSCNGLLLLCDRMGNLSIVNPVTREMRGLPPTCIDKNYVFKSYAFGYDSCNDDYIVVISFGRHMYNHSKACMFKRNIWKMIQKFPGSHFSSPGFAINGVIYWLGCRRGAPGMMIFVFDSAEEKFGEVEQPECFKEDDRGILDVTAHGGCLYLVVSCKFTSNLIEIWMIKEYGGRHLWTKLSVFHSFKFRFSSKPLYLWDGDAFMVMMHGKKLVLCNLKEETFKEIDIQGQGPSEFPVCEYTLWAFVDSLVSPHPINSQG